MENVHTEGLENRMKDFWERMEKQYFRRKYLRIIQHLRKPLFSDLKEIFKRKLDIEQYVYVCTYIYYYIDYRFHTIMYYRLYTYFIYCMLCTFNSKIHPKLYYAISRIK